MAGYTLAREFRKLDQTTPLTLISSDDGSSYPKPMLSNALHKNKTAQQIVMFDAQTMAKKLDAKIITNKTVKHIDSQSHFLILDDLSQHSYNKLILAVGASPASLSIEGDANKEVLSINNLQDYAIFREKLDYAKHVALIGPGLIGCEFANDLITNRDVQVSVIGPNLLPMDNLLPVPLALELQKHLSNAGVEWYLGATTKSLSYNNDGYDLQLSTQVSIQPDLVVSAIGLKPNISLASKAGLTVDHGIVTDQFLQTSNDDIYAIGDCAEVVGYNLLFVAPILAGAKSLAKTLTGELTPVQYPTFPVVVKTPLYPLIIALPNNQSDGEWHIETASSGLGAKALLVNKNNGALLGYVLSGDSVTYKQQLTEQLPKLLS